MSRSLSPSSSLESLRREARRWLKAISAGDSSALARYRSLYPESGPPRLRTVQQALAREHGFASWTALKQDLEDRARSYTERVRLFLEKSVNRYGTDPATQKWGDYESDGPHRGALAARLLARHPEIAQDSLDAAVAAHHLESVRAFLARNPALAQERSPFDGWTPLLRLAYARIPLEGAAHALEIARLLLDAGADPDAGWPQAPEFNALVGVIGQGEHGQAPHPQAEAFARLLIARGADPFVPQGLYNTSLGPDSSFWLDFFWEACAQRGETSRWTGPAPPALGAEKIPSALDYLLGNAVPHHPERIRWLLAHGADARGIHFYSREPVIKHAILAGREDVVALLMQHGAERPVLSAGEELVIAMRRGHLEQMRILTAAHPDLLRDPEMMFIAIQSASPAVVETLLDLGVPVDIADTCGQTPLHCAADCNAVDIARLLIARGAAIDPLEQRHGGSPLTHALYHEHAEMSALLIPLSQNFRGLCYAGAADRLRELLTVEPDRVHREDRPGETALFCLPEEEDKAVEIAELLLSFGADPRFRNPQGRTPAEVARRRGLDEAAALIEEAASAG